MQVTHGEPGCTGYPARLSGLDAYGVRGNGKIQIGNRDENPVWLPEERTESVGSVAYDGDYALQHWPGIHPENISKALGEELGRLTGPIQFVLKLLGFWRLQTSDAVGLLGFNSVDAEHVAAVLRGREQFRGRDVRDRIAHLFHIRATLRSLFRDLETENNWLREPNPLLDEKSPLSLMLGGSMEDLLLTKEYVQSVAGR